MDELKELNLLFLEDNEEFAKNTTLLLELYFKKVTQKSSVKDALRVFNESRVDVIITDIKVEDGNGLDFITAVRKSDVNVPILVLSAHKDEDFLLKAIPLNISAYELKPITYDNLVIILEKINKKFQTPAAVRISKNTLYNSKTKEITEDEKTLLLTKKEALFIELLIKNRDLICTHEMIQKEVYQEEIMSLVSLKNIIFRLRKKLSYDIINTVNNVGYRLKEL